MNDLAIALRKRLHEIPERSGAECQTRAMLIAFLKSHTTLEVKDMGTWLYAAHREGDGLPGVMLRADMDAVSGPNGAAFHGCGHDGHCANLAALALACEGRTFGKNLFFLFQPAEETGAGARECLALFERERIDAVYGMHNLPGFAKGTVMVRGGTFACASKGLTLRFTGRQCHAAYPETGLNPAYAMAALVTELKALTGPAQGELVLCTLVHMRVGERAFGVSAGDGELALTLRAERLEALDALQERIVNHARELCREQGLGLETAEDDVFPDTRCREADVKRFCASAAAAGLRVERLEKPMRWSEDFGWYLRNRPGVFFGIGAGEEHAALHTPEYEYDDALIGTAVQAFLAAIESAEFASREHVK